MHLPNRVLPVPIFDWLLSRIELASKNLYSLFRIKSGQEVLYPLCPGNRATTWSRCQPPEFWRDAALRGQNPPLAVLSPKIDLATLDTEGVLHIISKENPVNPVNGFMSNLVIGYMKEHGIPQTTENYVALNFGGTIDDLEGENLIEVLDLIGEGILMNEARGSEGVQ